MVGLLAASIPIYHNHKCGHFKFLYHFPHTLPDYSRSILAICGSTSLRGQVVSDLMTVLPVPSAVILSRASPHTSVPLSIPLSCTVRGLISPLVPLDSVFC